MAVNNRLVVEGQAHVGQQIGVQFNDAVIHQGTFYSVGSADPPDRKHEVARAHLDAGNPRLAEPILRGLIHNGDGTTERAYLYVLSVLGGRSLSEITEEMSTQINEAVRLVEASPADDWRESLNVVMNLVKFGYAGFDHGSFEGERRAAVVAFSKLPMDRQSEIERHLNSILDGAMREHLDPIRRHVVSKMRMSGGRIERARKFFEHDPRQPMRWSAPPIQAKSTDWRDAALGAAATLIAVGLAVGGGNIVGATIGLVAVSFGIYLALRWNIIWEGHVRHAQAVWAIFTPQPPEAQLLFDKLIDQYFRQGLTGSRWAQTEGYRGYLKRRLHQQYPYDDRPGELIWLIKWHVDRADRQYVYRPAETLEVRRAKRLRHGWIGVYALGLAIWLGTGHYAACLVAIGGWWGIRGISRIVAVHRAQKLLDTDSEVLYGEEYGAFEKCRQELSDRPSDTEMGQWLYYDRSYILDEAIERANIRKSDLVSYVVLFERASFARKGRVAGGPPRYQRYIVHVFLLTKYGMRTTRMQLNMESGDLSSDRHQMFSYDVVASASVVEKSIRTFRPDGSSVTVAAGRSLQLTLVNGTCIADVKENPRMADGHRLEEVDEEDDTVAMRTSGFDSALRILEAVATEGRDWIAREEERKRLSRNLFMLNVNGGQGTTLSH
ncbi:hypothetical protein [Nocardia cyriacigeorgica]|nr:hypothetical protein [Nocardia cyriacigeorgica]